MHVGMVSVPGGTSGDGLAGVSGATAFTIYDHTCRVMGKYKPCRDGILYFVQQSFMPYTLTVETVAMSVGRAYFGFAYGDGKYSVRNNQCGCQSLSSGFGSAQKACKCAFPVSGVSKREIAADADAEAVRGIKFKARLREWSGLGGLGYGCGLDQRGGGLQTYDM
jgi:hypothetical protein